MAKEQNKDRSQSASPMLLLALVCRDCGKWDGVEIPEALNRKELEEFAAQIEAMRCRECGGEFERFVLWPW